MTTPSFDSVMEVLRSIEEPELHKDIVSLGMVKDLQIRPTEISLEILLTTPACPLKDRFTEEISRALKGRFPEIRKVDVRFGAEVKGSRPVGEKTGRLPGVKNVIAVGSGKGGVGKSTVAVNLALALKGEGARVGLLDSDIYGPSIPILCGVKEGERPQIAAGNRIVPIVRFEMPIMSMGFLMGPQEAVVWRGPMLSKMLQQFLDQVEWGELDYLIVDLPPGTGDVQISLSQMIPMSGAVVVTTPQDVAFADVVRAIKMFQMTKIPILGVIENMSGFSCPHCGESTTIFQAGRDADRYKKLDLPLLGTLPLDPATSVSGDEGVPIVVKDPKSTQAENFRKIARQLAAAQSVQNFQSDLELPSLS